MSETRNDAPAKGALLALVIALATEAAGAVVAAIAIAVLR